MLWLKVQIHNGYTTRYKQDRLRGILIVRSPKPDVK